MKSKDYFEGMIHAIIALHFEDLLNPDYKLSYVVKLNEKSFDVKFLFKPHVTAPMDEWEFTVFYSEGVLKICREIGDVEDMINREKARIDNELHNYEINGPNK